MRGVRVCLALVSVALTASTRAGARCGDIASDAIDLAAVRATVDGECDCAVAGTHGAYVRCVSGIVKHAVHGRRIRDECRSALLACARRSTCGRAGFITCCQTRRSGATRCRVRPGVAGCRAPVGGTACVGVFQSCCDACAAGACATSTTSTTSPVTSSTVSSATTTTGTLATTTQTTATATTMPETTTTETTTSTTTTTTTTLPPPVCGDAACDPREDCASCPDDCGACAPGCGDGTCDGAERCDACQPDCGFCTAQPGLPIAVPRCLFAADCCDDGCMPSFTVSSNGSDTAGWTGFFAGSSDTIIRSYLGYGPCDPPGVTRVIPMVSVGDAIYLNNGIDSAATNNVFGLTQCLFDNDINGREFLIPVFDSQSPSCTGNFGSNHVVSGFITVHLDAVTLATPRTVMFHAVFRPDVPGQPGALHCP